MIAHPVNLCWALVTVQVKWCKTHKIKPKSKSTAISKNCSYVCVCVCVCVCAHRYAQLSYRTALMIFRLTLWTDNHHWPNGIKDNANVTRYGPMWQAQRHLCVIQTRITSTYTYISVHFPSQSHYTDVKSKCSCRQTQKCQKWIIK